MISCTSKVNVSFPLLEMIEKMPAYAKFFKDLNSRKRNKEFKERILIPKEVSVAIQCPLPTPIQRGHMLQTYPILEPLNPPSIFSV